MHNFAPKVAHVAAYPDYKLRQLNSSSQDFHVVSLQDGDQSGRQVKAGPKDVKWKQVLPIFSH